MAPKTIRSQYHSTCRVCDGHIRPGDTIEWARGTKPAHIECVEQGQPQQPATQPAIDHAALGQTIAALHSDATALRKRIGEQSAEIIRLRAVIERLTAERDELHDECVSHRLRGHWPVTPQAIADEQRDPVVEGHGIEVVDHTIADDGCPI
jgi:hypothetical protein